MFINANMNTLLTPTILFDAINHATDAQIDSAWAILKYKEIGIYRKIACLSELFKLDFKDVIKELPQDENGRILDHKTRHLIHDALIDVS